MRNEVKVAMMRALAVDIQSLEARLSSQTARSAIRHTQGRLEVARAEYRALDLDT